MNPWFDKRSSVGEMMNSNLISLIIILCSTADNIRFSMDTNAGIQKPTPMLIPHDGSIMKDRLICLSTLFEQINNEKKELSVDETDKIGSQVQISEMINEVEMTNGLLKLKIDKIHGTFTLSKLSKNREKSTLIIQKGYWSQVGQVLTELSSNKGTNREKLRNNLRSSVGRFPPFQEFKITIDPKQNNGKRGEIAFLYAYSAKNNTAKIDTLPCDVEFRFTLNSGDPGIYTTAIWTHLQGYPGFDIGEARMALKLNPEIFDYLGIDENRNMQMPTGKDWDSGETMNLKEIRKITTGLFSGKMEHKYDYSAILAETPAFGWASTKKQIGLWLINPAFEYIAGGPTKVELTGHLDCNPGGLPTLLNMWHGSHYGGSKLRISSKENWQKIIGPTYLYVNENQEPKRLWQDAQIQAKKQQSIWPFAWFKHSQYPTQSARGSLSGSVRIQDRYEKNLKKQKVIHIGLVAPIHNSNNFANSKIEVNSSSIGSVDWQRDSKNYQFWTRANDDGSFCIPNVIAGEYTLVIFADGVLGEFQKPGIKLKTGEKVQIEKIIWEPKRFGRTLWEIGIPNRSAEEFHHGKDYWQTGLYQKYPKEFPNDIHFTIGKSNWERDWNYCQPAKAIGGKFSGPVWTIEFNENQKLTGTATLRLGIAGSRTRKGLSISLNGDQLEDPISLPNTGVMHRDGIRGYWVERSMTFPASKIKKGKNQIQLKLLADSWVEGILYDYIRLEYNDQNYKDSKD